MRLTKEHRQAIAKAAANDIPQVDYEERVRELIDADIEAHLPPQVRPVYANPRMREEYLANTTVHIRADNPSVEVDGRSRTPNYYQNHYCGAGYRPSQMLRKKIVALLAEGLQQRARVKQAERTVLQALAPLRTTDQVREAYPQLAKYLPTEEAPAKHALVPVDIDPIGALRALGWPKEAPSQ